MRNERVCVRSGRISRDFMQAINMTSHYEFNHVVNAAIDDIADKWLSLAPRSDQAFFLQWPWIGNWLATVKPFRHYLVVALEGTTVVGLAILVEHTQWRHGFVRAKQLCLHRTGIATDDEIWIEYNDFLLDKCHANAVRSQMFRYICDNLDFDELVFGASDNQLIANFADSCSLTRVDIWRAKSYCVQFHDAPSDSFDSYLSANSRYQIKRSLKLYPDYQLQFAQNSAEALLWLNDIADIHQRRWPQSGFLMPTFTQFHQRMLTQAIADGAVQLIKITLDAITRVYLYNFIHAGKVYFYLSAIAEPDNLTASNNKAKPGLAAHYLAIEYYKKQGYQAYDFMGGDARYKSSFSNEISELCISKFQKPRLQLRLELWLKRLKHRYCQWRSQLNSGDMPT